jgi:competence protein ComEC
LNNKSGIIAALKNFFVENLRKEADDWALWLPVFFVAGIFLRFSFQRNNYLFILLLIAIISIKFIKSKIFRCFALCAVFFGLGYARADIFLFFNKTPAISERLGRSLIYGKIESEKITLMESGEYKKEIVLKLDKIVRLKTGREVEEKPDKLLIRLNDPNEKVYLSDAVVEADIFPIENKKFPSDFDYKKYLYYQGIGGAAYRGKIVKNSSQENLTLGQKIDIFRYNFAQRIISARDSRSTTVIATLLTGQKNLVDKDAMNSMNYSGLSHLLSIAGLHMMVLINSIFFIARWILLRSEKLALRYNVNKIAMIISMFFNFIYLLLSGFSISAIRAYIVCLIFSLSLLLERSNDAKRSVFFVLFLISLYNPNNVFHVAFQLSFLSVASIISSIKYYNAHIRMSDDNILRNTLVGKFFNFMLLNFIISLTAEIANTPITVYNFNNYTFYNVLTNLLAGPLISFIILPCSMISMALYFVGLEYVLVIPASYATDIVLLISDYILSIKNAVIFLPSPNNISMFFMIFGIIFFSILKTNLKHLGIALYFVGVLLFATQREPDVFINREDRAIYFVNEEKKVFAYNPGARARGIIKKIGSDSYTDISKAYRGKKYLIFRKNEKTIKINLKTFDFSMEGGESRVENYNGFLRAHL